MKRTGSMMSHLSKNGNGNGHGRHIAAHALPGLPFTAEDVTNVAQIASFVAQVCSDAGHHTEGLHVADVLGDLARRITQSLPITEQLRLTAPPLAVQQEPTHG